METLAILLTLMVGLMIFWFWQEHLRDSIEENVLFSCGAADKHALDALRDLERLQGKSTQDRFQEARLLDLNLHEGRAIHDPVMLSRVVDGYSARAQDVNVDLFAVDQIEHFVERNRSVLSKDDIVRLVERPVVSHGDELTPNIDKASAHKDHIEKVIQHTADPQNVHDSGVNEQLRGTIKRLRERTFPVRDADCIKSDIEALIDTDRDPTRRSRAHNSLDAIIKKGSFDGTIGANEKEVLALVCACTI